MSTGHSLRVEYESTGMLRQALPLADASVIPALIEDLEVFREAMAAFLRQGAERRVPYLLTDAIRRVAFDAAIVEAVSAVLGIAEPLVMWGPNIREDIPNQAGCWHVDCESFHWPTITLALGLSGCHGGNATHYIPGSHRLGRHPAFRPNGEAAATVADAQALDVRCDRVCSFEGFDNGKFYLFDAAGWHAGDPAVSAGRKLLFMHYQRASAPRIPYMLDYGEGRWFDYPAVYLSSGGRENRALYATPSSSDRMTWTLRGALYRLRHGVARS
jgi:hypothetical protein